MSDSLTCGPIHHHNVDVQMFTHIHIEEVLSQTSTCLLLIPVDQFSPKSGQTFSLYSHSKASKVDLDGVHVECHCMSKNNSLTVVS